METVLRIRCRDARGNVDPSPAEIQIQVQVGLDIVWGCHTIVQTEDAALSPECNG